MCSNYKLEFGEVNAYFSDIYIYDCEGNEIELNDYLGRGRGFGELVDELLAAGKVFEV